VVIEYTTLRILFEVPEPDAGGGGGGTGDGDSNDWLRLQQVPYEKPPASGFGSYVDSLARGLAIVTMADLLAKYNSACEENGCLEIEIQVHKSRADLHYTITASYGTLSQQHVNNSTQTKSITVRGEDSINLDHVPTGSVSAEWEGNVIGANGSILNPKPEITVDGLTLSFGQKVVGTIRISYGESHDTYILTIEPRAADAANSDDAESTYQSTVVAVWDGGIEVLEISLPGGLDDGNCQGGGNSIVAINDDDEEKCIRLIEVRDPCTEELTSSREEEIDCPEEESEEESS